MQCVALSCIALRCVALRCVALYYVALLSLVGCVALRCVVLRCTALIGCGAPNSSRSQFLFVYPLSFSFIHSFCSALLCSALLCSFLHSATTTPTGLKLLSVAAPLHFVCRPLFCGFQLKARAPPRQRRSFERGVQRASGSFIDALVFSMW